MAEINLLAIISPKPGKADRVLELFKGVAELVEKHEPDTLKYEISTETKRSGEVLIIASEKYKNKAALGAHASTPAFKAFQKAFESEDLLAAPTQLKSIKRVGGFTSRL